jgi:hypothetical protein
VTRTLVRGISKHQRSTNRRLVSLAYTRFDNSSTSLIGYFTRYRKSLSRRETEAAPLILSGAFEMHSYASRSGLALRLADGWICGPFVTVLQALVWRRRMAPELPSNAASSRWQYFSPSSSSA